MQPIRSDNSLATPYASANEFKAALLQLAQEVPDCKAQDISTSFLPARLDSSDPMLLRGYVGVQWGGK